MVNVLLVSVPTKGMHAGDVVEVVHRYDNGWLMIRSKRGMVVDVPAGNVEERPTKNAERCRTCGEWIRRPLPRLDGSVVCNDCYCLHRPPPGCSPNKHSDIQYHGGQFNTGEW